MPKPLTSDERQALEAYKAHLIAVISFQIEQSFPDIYHLEESHLHYAIEDIEDILNPELRKTQSWYDPLDDEVPGYGHTDAEQEF